MEHNRQLDRLIVDGIEERELLRDVAAGLKEISGKLDTLIALEQVEVKRQQERLLQR